jgi:viroplasmin and RNaseH domain-containing protein
MEKYYAVKEGIKPGIYLTWKECSENVNGYSMAKYKKFESKEEAEEMQEHHAECFPNLDYWIMEHDEDDDKVDEPRHYNENACDGWEDIYSY